MHSISHTNMYGSDWQYGMLACHSAESPYSQRRVTQFRFTHVPVALHIVMLYAIHSVNRLSCKGYFCFLASTDVSAYVVCQSIFPILCANSDALVHRLMINNQELNRLNMASVLIYTRDFQHNSMTMPVDSFCSSISPVISSTRALHFFLLR